MVGGTRERALDRAPGRRVRARRSRRPAARPGARRRAHAPRARARGDRVTDPARLSLNLITVDHWSLAEAVERCAAAGIGWVGAVAAQAAAGAEQRARRSATRACAARACAAAASSPHPAPTRTTAAPSRRPPTLGAECSCSCAARRSTATWRRARATIAAGIERLLPYAAEHGVRLGIEPLHPMLIAERSAIVSLGEALTLADALRRPGRGRDRRRVPRVLGSGARAVAAPARPG